MISATFKTISNHTTDTSIPPIKSWIPHQSSSPWEPPPSSSPQRLLALFLHDSTISLHFISKRERACQYVTFVTVCVTIRKYITKPPPPFVCVCVCSPHPRAKWRCYFTYMSWKRSFLFLSEIHNNTLLLLSFIIAVYKLFNSRSTFMHFLLAGSPENTSSLSPSTLLRGCVCVFYRREHMVRVWQVSSRWIYAQHRDELSWWTV